MPAAASADHHIAFGNAQGQDPAHGSFRAPWFALAIMGFLRVGIWEGAKAIGIYARLPLPAAF